MRSGNAGQRASPPILRHASYASPRFGSNERRQLPMLVAARIEAASSACARVCRPRPKTPSRLPRRWRPPPNGRPWFSGRPLPLRPCLRVASEVGVCTKTSHALTMASGILGWPITMTYSPSSRSGREAREVAATRHDAETVDAAGEQQVHREDQHTTCRPLAGRLAVLLRGWNAWLLQGRLPPRHVRSRLSP